MADDDLSAFGGPGRITSDPRGRDQRNTPTSTTSTGSTANTDPDATDPRGRDQRNTPAPANSRTPNSANTEQLAPARSRPSTSSAGGTRSGPRENWLNTVTLGTYKFTLYVTDDEVWNNPSASIGISDEAALKSGKACIISESGVESAYAIENVVILTSAANPGTGNIDTTQITFELLEPLGFSLLDKLLAVGQELNRPLNINGLNLVLKLEFLGRDPDSGASKKYIENMLYRGRIGGITGSVGAAGAKYFVDFMPVERIALTEAQMASEVTVKDVKDVKSFTSSLQKALNDNEKSIMQPDQAKPLREWVVRLGRTRIAARDYLSIPSFDLSTAPWAGTVDSSTTAGQAEMLEELGPRQITLDSESGLITHIQQKIQGNTPTFAEWLIAAREKGIVESIRVTPSVVDLGENDDVLNLPRQKITLTIDLFSEATIPPNDSSNVQSLRNTKTVQSQRFDNEILPWIVKKYSYLYTGENTEVIDIDLELNALFFNAKFPAAGIYYANNRQQFEANIVLKEETSSSSNTKSNPASVSGKASARYLSDIKRNKYNILQSPVFAVSQMGPQTQQRNETTPVDTIAATAIAEYSKRVTDSQNLTIQVRGDPIFMGGDTVTGNNIFDTSTNALYVAFVNFQPDPEDLLLNQMRGPVDMITTGIYRIITIESKFQQGSFTQVLTTVKDNNTTVFHVLDKLIEMDPK